MAVVSPELLQRLGGQRGLQKLLEETMNGIVVDYLSTPYWMRRSERSVEYAFSKLRRRFPHSGDMGAMVEDIDRAIVDYEPYLKTEWIISYDMGAYPSVSPRFYLDRRAGRVDDVRIFKPMPVPRRRRS